MRFFFYSHDGMGLGHARRQIAIATALNEIVTDSHILLATSVDEVARLGLPPNADTLKLPGLRKVANGQYSSRRLGISKTEMHKLRSGLLLQAVRCFRPDVILVDKHPFGVGGELEPALRAARSQGARLVLGLRDILDDPVVVKKEWEREKIQQRLCDFFDKVLIYGVQEVFDSIRSYGFSDDISVRAKYCGYVVNTAESAPHNGHSAPERSPSAPEPQVLCTVGGGEDGFGLLETFLEACNGARWNATAVAGPMLPENEFRTLTQKTSATNVTVHSFIPCVSKLFASTDAIVCMGGYNTLLEALSEGIPTVCVPRASPRSEQLMRALAFEKLGLLRVIPPDQLTPDILKSEIITALKMSQTELLRRARHALNFNGASVAGQHVLDVVRKGLHSNGHSRHVTRPSFVSTASAA